MLRRLEQLRMGLISSEKFINSDCERRANNLEVSSFVDIENTRTSGINCLDVNSEGSALVSGSVGGSIHIHSLINYSKSRHYTCKLKHSIDKKDRNSHLFSVESIQWYSVSHTVFVSSSTDKTVRIWNADVPAQLDCIRCKYHIHQHDVHPLSTTTSSLVSVASAGPNVYVLDLRTGSQTHELVGHSGPVYCCRWSPLDEYILATGSYDKKVILWDVRATRSNLMTLDQHNGKMGTSEQWQISHDSSVSGICYTRNGLFLLTYGAGDYLRLWNAKNGTNEMVNYGYIPNCLRTVQMDVSDSPTRCNVYIPALKYIFGFNVHTGQLLEQLSGHFSSATCCRYYSERACLYSGGGDNALLCWSCENTEEDCKMSD